MTKFYNAAKEAAAGVADDDKDALNNNDEMKEVATTFLSLVCPELIEVLNQHDDGISASDRLVKVGRNIVATLRYGSYKDESVASMDQSLETLASECTALAKLLGSNNNDSSKCKVPKVRFGKTELQMPILTMGCMRFQQTWNRGGRTVDNIDQVDADCQDNLVHILKHAIHCGVTHIENAKAYGCSEIQMGAALKTLFESGQAKREDLIIQTKGGISSNMTPQGLKDQVQESLTKLQLDYVDLFSLHGMNDEDHYKWVFDNGEKDNLIDAIAELKAEGKIRHLGFSTHAAGPVISKFLNTDAFAYVNMHYHFEGSYTASGDGMYGGNLENVRLCHEKDMGLFIISPFDKGGRLYAPSNKLRSLTLPEFEPITYGSIWLWQHGQFDAQQAPIHTIVCGAARPSDLDQPVLASLLLSNPETAKKRAIVSARLEAAMNEALGEEWVRTWHVGLPNCTDSKYGTQHGNLVWLNNVIKAFGLVDFGKDRYGPWESFLSKWDDTKTKEENIKAMGPGWSWMAGCGVDPTTDYSVDLVNCPEENRERLKEALLFTYQMCSKAASDSANPSTILPTEYETAYDMRPWTAFPERS
eukprot:CAMPEP_0198295124 /NCGR_PEP_ID=MMETSP1449-20131203/25970_1 /TAXON_ID=420275 /ORGANISM="Attheya septentrionalis, Strain CCMP2084" /LENGTH=586 /DNA_ID=CAMNT_0043995319 /DNA_START=182 /DNA_END=1942 /DNA_ORIENTATION=-